MSIKGESVKKDIVLKPSKEIFDMYADINTRFKQAYGKKHTSPEGKILYSKIDEAKQRFKEILEDEYEFKGITDITVGYATDRSRMMMYVSFGSGDCRIKVSDNEMIIENVFMYK